MEKCILTKEQAIETLNEWDDVHCFKQTGLWLIWTDRSRESVLEAIEDSVSIEIWWPVCRSMWHWLLIHHTDSDYSFFACDDEVLWSFDINNTEDK